MNIKKKKSDLDRASDLLLMVASGLPLDPEDQLWLENWKALMQEVEETELAPTVMFTNAPPPLGQKPKKAKKADKDN
jgi:hypothetical protein